MHGVARGAWGINLFGLLGLHDIGKGDETQPTNIGIVEGAICRNVVLLTVGEGSQFVGPRRGHLIVWRGRVRITTRNAGGCGHVLGEGNYLDAIGVEVAVCDGLGGSVEDWRNMVFRLDMRGDSRGLWL